VTVHTEKRYKEPIKEMVKKSNKQGKKNKARKAGRGGMVNPDSLTYRGPLKIPSTLDNRRLTVGQLHYAGTGISSSAAGVISGNIGIGNPSGASAWAAFAALYDEFRVLSFVVEFTPYDRYSAPLAVTTSIVEPALLIAIDRDSAATPTTLGQLAAYESCRQVSLSDPFRMHYKMDGVREATWVTTASPSSSPARGFEWIGTSNSATNSYFFGNLFCTWIVQFRGVDA
jgi:hypothetical protein